MNKTSIEWCRTYRGDGTFTQGYTVNPIRFRPHSSKKTVTMCQHVSPGCKNCYAGDITRRFWPKDAQSPFPGYTALGVLSGEFLLDANMLAKVLKRRKPCRIFWGDMTDLFADWVKSEWLERIFDVCLQTPHLTHMFLTKRPERMKVFKPPKAANIWLGVSIENDDYVWRADDLRATDAAVKFISVEPLLAPLTKLSLQGIDWLITGAESGPGARPMDEKWVRSLRDQCEASSIAFFYKQRLDDHGSKVPTPLLDGKRHVEFPRVGTRQLQRHSSTYLRTLEKQHEQPRT